MKKELLFIIICIFPIGVFAQFESDFESGTFENWSNIDGSTTMVSNEMHAASIDSNLGNHFLLKTSDGSATPVGQLAISHINDPSGGGEFMYGEQWGINFQIYVKNSNNFPLELRIGIRGANDAIVVTQTPVIVPAMTDWTYVSIGTQAGSQPSGYGNLATLDTGTYNPSANPSMSFMQQTLSNVMEVRLLHNPNVSFDGATVAGTLEFDEFFTFIPLSVTEKFLQQVKIFPNPVADQLFVSFPHVTKGTCTLTSIDGKQLLSKTIDTSQLQLDMSEIKAKGMYFLKISTPEGTITKKIIKK